MNINLSANTIQIGDRIIEFPPNTYLKIEDGAIHIHELDECPLYLSKGKLITTIEL